MFSTVYCGIEIQLQIRVIYKFIFHFCFHSVYYYYYFGYYCTVVFFLYILVEVFVCWPRLLPLGSFPPTALECLV